MGLTQHTNRKADSSSNRPSLTPHFKVEPRFSNNRTTGDDALRRTPDTCVAKSEELAAVEKFRMHKDNWIPIDPEDKDLNIDLNALGPISLKKPQSDI